MPTAIEIPYTSPPGELSGAYYTIYTADLGPGSRVAKLTVLLPTDPESRQGMLSKRLALRCYVFGHRVDKNWGRLKRVRDQKYRARSTWIYRKNEKSAIQSAMFFGKKTLAKIENALAERLAAEN